MPNRGRHPGKTHAEVFADLERRSVLNHLEVEARARKLPIDVVARLLEVKLPRTRKRKKCKPGGISFKSPSAKFRRHISAIGRP